MWRTCRLRGCGPIPQAVERAGTRTQTGSRKGNALTDTAFQMPFSLCNWKAQCWAACVQIGERLMWQIGVLPQPVEQG